MCYIVIVFLLSLHKEDQTCQRIESKHEGLKIEAKTNEKTKHDIRKRWPAAVQKQLPWAALSRLKIVPQGKLNEQQYQVNLNLLIKYK